MRPLQPPGATRNRGSGTLGRQPEDIGPGRGFAGLQDQGSGRFSPVASS